VITTGGARRRRVILALASGILASAASTGCEGPGPGSSLPYVFVPNVSAIIDDKIGRQQAFAQALQFERWDDAIAMAEDACRSASVQSYPACLNLRVKAYEARAYAHARGNQFDTALADELRASEAAEGLIVANSEYETYLRNLGSPSSVAAMQTKIAADQTARTRAIVHVRLEAYRLQKLPDPTVEALAMSSGVVMPPGSPAP
jgi:hypothetical protein